jgi:polysaccharide export outer membrane protein
MSTAFSSLSRSFPAFNVKRFYIMKRSLPFFLLVLMLLFSSLPAFAQMIPGQAQGGASASLLNSALQEMQRSDPQSAQALQEAISKGDIEGAKKIYRDFKSKQAGQPQPVSQPTATQPTAPPSQSMLEKTMSGDFSDIQPSSLKQFGYDLFTNSTGSFIPPAMIPVGPDYIIGPGDQFTLTLWGTTEGIFTLQVSKEGEIILPKVGVVSVSGLRFGELEKTLRRHLTKYYRDVNLSVAMGNLRTITVYVVGQVQNPGSYTLSSLSTAFAGLVAAGGPTKKGSLRSIQVLRRGKVIRTIDLYDFLLKGDRSQDIKLQNDDTVFTPLIGPVAGVSGAVYRPAIYEMKGKETIGDLLLAAGGVMPVAFSGRVQLNRFVDNHKQMIFDIKIASSTDESFKKVPELREKVFNMDVITVFPLYPAIWETVNLGGAVKYPGDFQWRPDLRVREVIEQGQLLPTSDMQRGEVIRLSDDFRSRIVIPVNIGALMKGDESQNILLKPKDQVRVYTQYRMAETVMLSGEVMKPGTYEINQGERLSDVVRRAGGFTPNAYPYGAVFKRPSIKNFQSKQMNAFIMSMQQRLLQQTAEAQATAISAEESTIQKAQLSVSQQLVANLKAQQDLAEGRVALNVTKDIDAWAGTKEDPVLQDGDSFDVPKSPQEISVIGEVYNPGAVTYQDGRTVKDYIGQTGGYTEYAQKDNVFVLQANGIAVSNDTLSHGNVDSLQLKPGDAVMVPQNVERHATMRNTKDIIDIIFKTAMIVAAIAVLHL